MIYSKNILYYNALIRFNAFAIIPTYQPADNYINHRPVTRADYFNNYYNTQCIINEAVIYVRGLIGIIVHHFLNFR